MAIDFIFGLMGVTCILTGAWLISFPAFLITLGLIIVALSITSPLLLFKRGKNK